MEDPPSREVQIEDDSAVARVIDPGSTASDPHICTQLAPASGFLTIVRSRSGGFQALAEWLSGPSSGDCAGPLADSLGAFTLPARRLPGPREAYDLSGTRTFGSGPYTVTLKSSIRARRSPVGGNGVGLGGGGPFNSPKPHEGLVEQVSMQYRVTNIGGTFTTTFAGRPDPFCMPLDACGASGIITDAISGVSSRLELDAQRVVKRRVSRQAALADLRSGRLPLFDTGVLLTAVLSANAGWPTGSACKDRTTQLNALSFNATASRHKHVRFSLETDATEDPLRTICPGPAAGGVLGSSGTLASTQQPLADLGRRRLRIAVSRHRRFTAGSYAGSDGGRLTVRLQLVRVRAGTKAEGAIPGDG